ncbi:MAG: ion transporter [Pirellulaceae bacterium]|nr:ion transporter [Pirellulaceae bacterium]
MNKLCRKLVESNGFTQVITFLIILNSILIGFELDYPSSWITMIQSWILCGFVLEIAIRWTGKKSVAEYVSEGWNWFDVVLVALAFIPEAWISNPEMLTAFRILRVFRIFRLNKAFPELQVITKVLLKSSVSLFFVCLLMLIVLYLYAIIGVILFRGGSEVITGIGPITDPFGSVPEAMFSMFRVLTGEDWTDFRYDLLDTSGGTNDTIVSLFFLSFFIISAFLLLNIVVGAVVNNYDQVMGEEQKEATAYAAVEELAALHEKLDKVMKKLDTD